MRSGSDWPSVVDPMIRDGCGISSPPIRAFNFFVQLLKFGRPTIKSISQSISAIYSHQNQIPDFSAKMYQIQFRMGLLPIPR